MALAMMPPDTPGGIFFFILETLKNKYLMPSADVVAKRIESISYKSIYMQHFEITNCDFKR